MTLRVLVADDHLLFAEAICELLTLQPDMAVVGVASTGADAVRGVIKMNPNVVLMDHFMPEINGTEATRLITSRYRQTRVLMVCSSSHPAQIVRALQAGASGYVAKWCSSSELIAGVREVHAGRRYIQHELSDTVLKELVRPKLEQEPLARLSSRERQVLQMIAEGRSISMIADSLSLSVKTVETYRARLKGKLGIRNLTALVRFAIQERLIPLE